MGFIRERGDAHVWTHSLWAPCTSSWVPGGALSAGWPSVCTGLSPADTYPAPWTEWAGPPSCSPACAYTPRTAKSAGAPGQNRRAAALRDADGKCFRWGTKWRRTGSLSQVPLYRFKKLLNDYNMRHIRWALALLFKVFLFNFVLFFVCLWVVDLMYFYTICNWRLFSNWVHCFPDTENSGKCLDWGLILRNSILLVVNSNPC